MLDYYEVLENGRKIFWRNAFQLSRKLVSVYLVLADLFLHMHDYHEVLRDRGKILWR